MLKKKEDNAFDALKRISDLERENKKLENENKKLMNDVKRLKFDLLSSKEKDWAKIAYDVLKGKDWEFINSFESFKLSYMDKKEKDSLPFDDLPFL